MSTYNKLEYVKLIFAEIENNKKNLYTSEIITTGKLNKIQDNFKKTHDKNIYFTYTNNLNNSIDTSKIEEYIKTYEKEQNR